MSRFITSLSGGSWDIILISGGPQKQTQQVRFSIEEMLEKKGASPLAIECFPFFSARAGPRTLLPPQCFQGDPSRAAPRPAPKITLDGGARPGKLNIAVASEGSSHASPQPLRPLTGVASLARGTDNTARVPSEETA